jgi:hypothetical protein
VDSRKLCKLFECTVQRRTSVGRREQTKLVPYPKKTFELLGHIIHEEGIRLGVEFMHRVFSKVEMKSKKICSNSNL